MNKNEVHIMIDLETFAVKRPMVIMQIGAVRFNPRTGETFETFKTNVDLESSVDAGFKMDSQTVQWWMKQDRVARMSVLGDPKMTIKGALANFGGFIEDMLYNYGKSDQRNLHIWSHATFDVVALNDAYDLIGYDKPWKYNTARDLRTLVYLADVDYGRKEAQKKRKEMGTPHDALDDCMYQVSYVKTCFDKLLSNKGE